MDTSVIAAPAGVLPAAAPPPLTCTVVDDPARLEALRPQWLDLLARSAANEPMLAPPWLLTWWRVYGQGTGRRLRVGLFADGDRLVGLAPLVARRRWYRPGIPFRRLEPLGADMDEGDGVCSDYLNVIAERGAERCVARAFAEALAAGRFGPWDEIVLPAMDGLGPMPTLLTEALTDAGLAASCTETGVAPYIPLPATWDDYLKALPKKKRYGVVRALRDFDEWAGGAAELRRAASSAELAEGKRILTDLHGQRWSEAGQSGVFAAPRFAAFHDAVMPALLQLGALDLAWLTVRGESVAAVYSLVWNGKVYFYQCGRRPDLPDGLRPGIVMLAHAIRGAIAAGHREFDFLGGVAVYKSQLALATRPLVQLRAVRPSLREWARRSTERGIGWARAVRSSLRSAARRVRGAVRQGQGQTASPAPEAETDATPSAAR